MTNHLSGTNRDMPSFGDECQFCHDNLEAEALGILEPAGHARFQRHLQWCGPCRRELADMHSVVNVLPLLSDVATPSPTAKARLFQQIADDAVTGATVNFGNPWETSAPKPSRPLIRPETAVPAWKTWLSTAFIAPLAIALIVLGAWTNSLRNDLNSMQPDDAIQAPSSVALGTTGGEMQLFSMQPTCTDCDDTPAAGHIGGNPGDNVGILVAWNLDPGQKHQVWCEKRNGELMMITDLDVEHTGQVAQMLNFPEAIGGYSTIYVTRYDGTEEMRVALPENIPADDATPGAPASN